MSEWRWAHNEPGHIYCFDDYQPVDALRQLADLLDDKRHLMVHSITSSGDGLTAYLSEFDFKA